MSWRKELLRMAREEDQGRRTDDFSLRARALWMTVCGRFMDVAEVNWAYAMRRLTLLRSYKDAMRFAQTAPLDQFTVPSTDKPCASPRKRLLALATLLYQTKVTQGWTALVAKLDSGVYCYCALGAVRGGTPGVGYSGAKGWDEVSNLLLALNDIDKFTFVQIADRLMYLAGLKNVPRSCTSMLNVLRSA